MTPIDDDMIAEVMARQIADGMAMDAMPFQIAAAALTALSSSGYIICQANDAETGEAVSRKSALQSDDGAEALTICAPLGHNQGCSVCERCKAEVLLAEADARECSLRAMNERLQQWLGVIATYPATEVGEANESTYAMQKIARDAAKEVKAAISKRPTEEPQGDDPTAEQTPLA